MDILTANDRPGEHPAASYYRATARPPLSFPPATGELSCDVCVVGGGYMGLSSALHLAQRGFDVVLLEAHRVGWGASGRNGGQVNVGHRLDQLELEAMVGLIQARALWELAGRAVALVKELIDQHEIDCDFRPGVVQADLHRRDVAQSRALAEKLARDYGCRDVHWLDRNGIRAEIGSELYRGGLRFAGGGHLHPLNYALGLARAAAGARTRIFERSRVVCIEPGRRVTVTTAGGTTVRADYLVLGINGYHGDLYPAVARHVMPINNFIIATEPLTESRARALMPGGAAAYDSNFVVSFYRVSADNRMLFGGGESYGWTFPPDIAKVVRPRMLSVFPQLASARIDYAWGGTLGITRTRLPFVHRGAGNILSAGGFSGQGVALATLSGAVIAESLAGQAGAFDIMASIPQRPFPGGALLRWPILVLAMTWFGLRDRL
jgi:gamma-glutamylputrescine oxidase